MSTKKTVKKVVPKKPATKKPATKKPATKKAVTKTSDKPATNKELVKMISKIDIAKKNGEKSVVVYTTSKNSHKANMTSKFGFGFSDLKPSLLSAYKYLLINYDLETKLVSHNDMAVEWIVKIKK